MTRRLATLIGALAAAASACVEEAGPHARKLSSFRVRITDPGEDLLGDPNHPMDAEVRDFTLAIEAIATDGQPFPAYQGDVELRLFFLSGVNPSRKVPCKSAPKAGSLALGPDCYRFQLYDGAREVAVRLSPTFGFGPSAFWVEAVSSPSFALGASETLWRPPVTVRAIQETSHPAKGPLSDRQVIIEGSSSPDGELVVTGVFAQSFAIYDTGEPSPWRSLLVYTFSQPRAVKQGMTVKNVSGTMQEFNGLTEVNFPQYEIADSAVESERVPAPVAIAAADLRDESAVAAMEPRESAPVRAVKWRVCGLEPGGRDWDGWTRFQQWKVAPALDSKQACPDREKSMSVISNTTVPAFQPVADDAGAEQPYKGKVVCRLDGILSHVVPDARTSAAVNLWMVNPRGPEDMGEVKDRPEECP